MKKLTLFILSFLTYFMSAQITWNNVEVEDGSTLQKMHVFNSNEAIIVGLNTTVKKTYDGGMTWSAVSLPDTVLNLGDADFMDVCFYGDTGYAIHKAVKIEEEGQPIVYINSNILYSTNKGNTWTLMNFESISDGSNNPATDPFADSCYRVEVNTIGVNQNGALYAWISWDEKNGESKTDHSRIYVTTDKGESWTDLLSKNFGTTYIKTILIKNDIGFIGGKDLFYEKDGNDWIDNSNLLFVANDSDSYYVNHFMPSGDSVIYITTTSDGVFSYNLNSKRYLKFNTAGGNATYHFSDDNYLVVGSSSKTVFTNNFGVNWDPVSAGSTLFNLGGLMGDNLFSLAKSDVYYFDITDIPTSFASTAQRLETSVKPIGYNKFVISCNESFASEIYNINGVRLSRQNLNTGNTYIDLNNYNSGIYILRIISNNGLVRAHKVIVK